MIIYHGSKNIIEQPIFGYGKRNNDYGQGFYCTENIDLAKEWACPNEINGKVNAYELDIEKLNVLYLTRGKFNILNWLAILLVNRNFEIVSRVGRNAKKYIIDNFYPNVKGIDVIVGYRADDSYFSYAEDFVNNSLSLRELNEAMRLGNLG